MFDDDFETNNTNVKDTPLYRKGKEILNYVMLIADLLPDDNTQLQSVKQFMIEDASTLVVKVVGAHHAELYDLKMEAAVLIRKAAHNLMIQQHSLKMFDFAEAGYFNVVRELIEEYRLLFLEWIKTFDPEVYVIDRWGLFNPPGVSPFDEPADEDDF